MDPVLDVCVRERIMDPVIGVCVREPIMDPVLDVCVRAYLLCVARVLVCDGRQLAAIPNNPNNPNK